MFHNIISRLRSENEHCCTRSNHIACLIKNTTKIVSLSRNDYLRQYVDRKKTTSMHAEVGCIKNFKNKKNLKKYNLLIIRFNKQGSLVDSRPCKDCKNYLKNLGITFVYCSCPDGTIKKIYLDHHIVHLSRSQIQFRISGHNKPDSTTLCLLLKKDS